MEGYGYGYEVFCTLWVFPLLFLSYDFNHLHHETIMQTRIALKKIINKSLLNLALLWNRARLAISKKKQKHFSLPDHQLSEILYQRKQRDKKVIVYKFLGIMITITLI